MPQPPPSPGLTSPNALDVLIVGGGLCGLATAISVAASGHLVTVFEAFETIHPFGSGLFIPPNGTRLLSKWGLDDILSPALTAPRSLQIHKLDGRLLASCEGHEADILRRYHFPLWTLHRPDLQRALTRRAAQLGVHICYSSRITDFDSSDSSITLANGQKRQGDLVIVADGAWSMMRQKVHQKPDIIPKPTGFTAYRLSIDRGHVRDPSLSHFMSTQQSRLWLGQGSYALCYPIRDRAQLSVLLVIPSSISSGETSTGAVVAELKRLAEAWDPLLVAIIHAVQGVKKWQLVSLSPTPDTFVSPDSKHVLAGDCIHSLHPFLSQGLNLGLEDAATLGHLLSHVQSVDQLPKALALYDKLRTERVQMLLEETCIQVDRLGLPHDEPKQRSNNGARDSSGSVQDWVSCIEQDWIWSYDAYEEAERGYANEPF